MLQGVGHEFDRLVVRGYAIAGVAESGNIRLKDGSRMETYTLSNSVPSGMNRRSKALAEERYSRPSVAS